MSMTARSVVLVAAVTLSAVGLSVSASAENHRGSPTWCRHHPKSTHPGCRRVGGTGGPPVAGITVSPNPIVETGDSDVYAVISVSTDPVYAEQTVEVVSGLSARCRQGVTWTTNQGSFGGSSASASVDDDGNATFVVLGGSCAAGSVPVVADVEAGTTPTYTTTLVIDPPAPGI
jgi:hypothetical protein